MSNQQRARNALRADWDALFADSLPSALGKAQERAAADAVIAVVWPTLRSEHMILLDRADRGFLLRGSAIPDCLHKCLFEELTPRVQAALSGLGSTNPHARGAKLRSLIDEQLKYDDGAIRDAAYKLFETNESDCLGSSDAVRISVLARLSDLILDDHRGGEGSRAMRIGNS